MPRRSIIPKLHIHLKLPMDLMMKVDLKLFSTVEGKVPYGGYSAFFEQLLRNHFQEPPT